LHGGLRYLANLEFGIVRESLRERRILGGAAPHLVRPLKFLVPIYAGEKPTRLEMKIALVLYEMLGFDRNRGVAEDKRLPAHSWLNRARVLKAEPGINPRGVSGGELKGAYIYWDYQSVFPERLLLDWALTGEAAGGAYYNHCEVKALHRGAGDESKTVSSATVRDTLTGEQHEVRSRLFINASGPYMDFVLQLADFESPPIQRSTGVHLITEPLFSPEKDHTVFIKGKRNDQFLILPWMGRSLIGPTDVPYSGHPDQVKARDEEIEALASDLEAALPPGVFRREMIRHVITGIRPLVSLEEPNKGPGSGGGRGTRAISRKSEIYDHAPDLAGLLSVGGGKWTTSRALGADVLAVVRKKLGPAATSGRNANAPAPSSGPGRSGDTRRLPFISAPGFDESAQEYTAFALREFSTPGIPDAVHRHLILLYGTRHTKVLDLARENPRLSARISEREDRLDIFAQVDFAVRDESALTLDDLVRRRLSLGTLERPTAPELLAIAEHAAKLLHWDAERVQNEIQSLKRFYPIDYNAS
jgi:glycerol-3-phosphate dehydrogenase